MKKLTDLRVFRLLALLLCLAATVPQLHADIIVAGSNASLFGGSWTTTTNSSNQMKQLAGTNYYYLAKTNVSLSGTTDYKVVDNGNWYPSNNQSFSANGTRSLVFIYNTSNHAVSLFGPFQYLTVAGSQTEVLGSSWAEADSHNDMTTTDGINYKLSFTDVNVTAGPYSFKVTYNHSWTTSWPSSNKDYTVGFTGLADVEYTFNVVTKDVGVTVTQKSVTPTTPDYYITGDNGLGLGGWSFNQLTTMTYDDNDEVYTYSYNVPTAGTYHFAFADGPGSDWTDFNNNHRYGPSSGDQTVTLDTWTTTQKGGGSYAVTVDAGQVTITFNTATMQFMVEGTAPVIAPDYYVMGDIFPNGWNTGASTLMTDNGDGTYSWTSGQIHLDMATNYEYKVYGSDGVYHPSGNNATFSTNVPGTYTIEVTYNSNNGNVNAVLNLVSADQAYSYTFYVLPNDNSVTPYLYLWGTNNNSYHPNGEWPGTEINNTEVLDDGNTWYKYTGSLYANLMNVIVNDNNGHQTSNITDRAPNTYYIRWNVSEGTYTITTDAPVPIVNYYVKGDNTSIFPNGWNTGASTLMTDDGNGNYTWTTAENVHLDAGTYQYKVYGDNETWYPSGNSNATFTIDVPGTYSVTITFDGTTPTATATLISADPSYSYTFYVLPNDNSVTPYLYLWGTNNNSYQPNGEWPGTEMDDTEVLDDNNTWYKYTGSLYANLMNVIVNDNNGHQTGDITDRAPDTYYIRWNVSEGTYTITTDAPVPIVNYYVKGDNTSIFPNGWNTGASTLMTDDGNGNYTWTTAENVHLEIGTYQYKVYGDNETWYPSGNSNATFTIDVPGTYSVTITFDGTTPTATATLISADPSYTYTFYVLPDDGNITPYLYLWDDDNYEYTPAGLWPGTAMTTTEVLDDGNTWHKYTGTIYVNLISAIVNNNGQDENRHQTGDITDLAPNTYYIRWNVNQESYTITTDAPQPAPHYDYTIYVRYKGDDTPYMYMWDGGGNHPLGDFPGTELTDANNFTTEVINGYTYYKYTVTASDYPTLSIIFNEGSNSAQTGNLAINPGTSYFTYGGGNTVDGPKAEADPAITWYAENSFIGWTTEGTQMTANGDGSYSKTFSEVNLIANTTYEYKVHGVDGTNAGVWIGDADGNNATFTPTVNGIYDVTITLNSDGTVSHTLTLIEATSQGTYYITGSQSLGLGWSYAPETEMTFDASTGLYTYTTQVAEGGMYNFVFGNGQGDDWADFNSNYRIGPASSNNQAITPDGNWNSTQMANGNDGSYSITVNPGTITFTLDPANMRFNVVADVLTHNYTFYVLPSDHQTVPYIYLWGLGTDEAYSNTYPGNQLTETEVLDDGNTWYKLSVNLTAEYIHALVNGGGSNADNTKTADITHIDPGTYYIYWTTTREPGESYNDYYLTTVAPTAAGGPLYLLGTYYYNKQQYHYSPSSGAQMKYDANTHLYYLNNVNLAVHNTFCFSTQLGDDWNSVGTRYGNSGDNEHVVGDGVTNYFAIDEDWINKAIALDEWSEINGEYRMLVPGIYNVLVNLEEKWVKLIKTDYYTLTPMNVFLEQTPNVIMSKEGNNFIQNPGTEYSSQIFGEGNWPLAAYNGTYGDGVWDPHDNGNNYPVTFIGDTTTVDGKKWWHWQVEASIAELFFTRLDTQPLQSDTIRRKAGVLWVTWDEVNGQATLTDHSREYFEAAANALPTNAVVMEGHYYVYFINTVDWDKVCCYAWDNNYVTEDSIDNTFYDGYSRLMSKWPGQPCELVGIDPVTGYEVWRYDFGTIIGTDIPNGGIIFNDGNEYSETEAKEQTGDFEYVNGAVYDYLGMVDGAFTLNNLIRKGAKDVRYTVSNTLLGVYYDKDAVTRIHYKNEYEETVHEDIVGALYAKDLNLYGEKSVMPDASYTDYVYDICASDHTAGRSQVMIKKTTYDQSNWVKLVISPNYDGGGAVVPKNERPDLSKFVNRLIPAGTLDVFMTDSINPTAHVLRITRGDTLAYEPNVYVSEHFNDTIVFNYVHQDWLGDDAKFPYAYSCQPRITWDYDTIEDVVTVTGGTAVRQPNYSHPYKMFYVAPKPQEIAYITWVVYDNYNQDGTWQGYTHGQYTPYTRESVSDTYPEDPGRFYSPMNWNRMVYIDPAAYPELSQITEATELEKKLGAWSPEYGPFSNGYMQYGGFKVNWSLFDMEASGGPWWQIIKPGQAYKFKAIIRYARGSAYSGMEGEINDTINNYYYGPSNGYFETEPNGELIPGPGTVFNAPRRSAEETGYANMYFTDYDYLTESKFIIFPIEASSSESNGHEMGNVTSVKEVITNVATSRTVSSVRYYNLMGAESDKPFDGINIMVITYSDGSRFSRKVLR